MTELIFDILLNGNISASDNKLSDQKHKLKHIFDYISVTL